MIADDDFTSESVGKDAVVVRADGHKIPEILQEYSFMNVSVIEGSGIVDGIEIKKGAHFILPHNYGIVKFEGKWELIFLPFRIILSFNSNYYFIYQFSC